MKKLITVSLLLISVSISFSQSKKQQIETLTYKLGFCRINYFLNVFH